MRTDLTNKILFFFSLKTKKVKFFVTFRDSAETFFSPSFAKKFSLSLLVSKICFYCFKSICRIHFLKPWRSLSRLELCEMKFATVKWLPRLLIKKSWKNRQIALLPIPAFHSTWFRGFWKVWEAKLFETFSIFFFMISSKTGTFGSEKGLTGFIQMEDLKSILRQN